MRWHDAQARRDELYRDPQPLYGRARRAEGLMYVPESGAPGTGPEAAPAPNWLVSGSG
ncbi:hypothetical protein ACWGIU_30640 [Streptomyces sp. NPDC054840]